MIIICDAPGQTCNRLWSYVDSIARCIVLNKKMVIIFFDYTIDDLPNFKKCPFIYFPLYNRWLLSIGNNWGRFKHLTWKATHNDIINKVYRSLGFINGWSTRVNTCYITAAKDELKKIFTPSYEIVNKSEYFIHNIREEFDIIIGVHIRRGDYISWNNGAFYYNFDVYDAFLKQLQNLYIDKKVAFFISSNELINDSYFIGSSCFYYKSSTAMEDLYTLSLCDKIIGPFSTFSRWASFIGEKPLCFLESPNMIINESDFSVIIDYYHFANGKEIADW